jgi:hypothetical protein
MRIFRASWRRFRAYKDAVGCIKAEVWHTQEGSRRHNFRGTELVSGVVETLSVDFEERVGDLGDG